MIYVFLENGTLFYDSDLFDFMVIGNMLYIFNDRNCVASFDRNIVKIVDEHNEALYLGENYYEK